MLKGIGLAGARKVGTAEAEGRNPWAGLRELWTLAQPHRALLAASLLLIVINRVAALVFPGSTRILIDEVIAQHKTYLLLPLIGMVLAATATQGIPGKCPASVAPRLVTPVPSAGRAASRFRSGWETKKGTTTSLVEVDHPASDPNYQGSRAQLGSRRDTRSPARQNQRYCSENRPTIRRLFDRGTEYQSRLPREAP